MTAAKEQAPLKVYWQPGCSSCLKVKEFLLARGVQFESINVLDDEEGIAELASLGLKIVPIVARAGEWAHGADFRQVARLAGFEWHGYEMLSPRDLVSRIDTILSVAHRLVGQCPDHRLDRLLPGRPRSFLQLAYHVSNIPEVFLDYVEHGTAYTYEALADIVPPQLATKEQLLNYNIGVRARLDFWWRTVGKTTDFSRAADVYYGDVSLHEVLERTAWHAGQHTRQLALALKDLGIEPDRPLTDRDVTGLPMPLEVWDNEVAYDSHRRC